MVMSSSTIGTQQVDKSVKPLQSSKDLSIMGRMAEQQRKLLEVSPFGA